MLNAWFPIQYQFWFLVTVSLSSFFFKTVYNKTIIRFGFCDILNSQGLGKCYQPWPSTRLITLTSTLIFLDITKASSNNCLEMESKYLKIGWNCDSDKENLDNHSKIPTATWPSLQYVKQPLLEFRPGTYREPNGAPPLRLPRNTTPKENGTYRYFSNWDDHRQPN